MNASQGNPSRQFGGQLELDPAVLGNKKSLLVLFWAAWSRPCQVMDAVLAEVAAKGNGGIEILKVNADDNPELSLWYDIQSIPTLLFFRDGQPRARVIGTASTEAILAKWEALSHGTPIK